MRRLFTLALFGMLCASIGIHCGWSFWGTLAFTAIVYTAICLIAHFVSKFLRRASSNRVPM